ncbi:MAG: tetratricopeptide repeat protein [Elusimicrobia bacterium]|nr:tetratricopeptide repeat protein [Elusimicrobiota bacterium]
MPWVVAGLTFLAFVPALESLFVNWDDQANFLENPDFRGLGMKELGWMFSTFHLAHYQPVTWLSWALDKALWGTNPFGYHLTNLLLHCGMAALFYLVCRRFLDRGAPESAGIHPWAAAWAALFFAVHPLRVEAVAWATERRELLSGLLYLWAVVLYLKRHQEGAGRQPSLWRVTGVGALAMLSNVRSVSLPVALLVLDYYPLDRLRLHAGGSRLGLVKEKLPLFGLALGAGLLGLLAQFTTYTLIPMAKAGLPARLEQTCFGVAFYLWKTLAPWGLSNWYGDSYMAPRTWLVAAGALAAVLLTLWLAWRGMAGRGRVLFAAWLWYLVTLSPTLGLVKSGRQIVADRYSYLPSLALALLCAAGLAKLRAKTRQGRGPVFVAAAACALAVLPLLGSLTWRQCRVWNDTVSLWSRAVSVDPRSVFIRTNHGIALLQARRFDEAVRAFESIREDTVDGMDPDSGVAFFGFIRFLTAMTHHNWGVDLMYRDRPLEAEEHLRKSLFYNPDLESGRTALGLALLRSGKLDAAIPLLQEAMEAAPDAVDPRLNLAQALAAKGRKKEALAQYEAALKLSPGDPGVLEARARLLDAGRKGPR